MLIDEYDLERVRDLAFEVEKVELNVKKIQKMLDAIRRDLDDMAKGVNDEIERDRSIDG